MNRLSALAVWKAVNLGYAVLLALSYVYFSRAYDNWQVGSLTPFAAAGVLTVVVITANDLIIKRLPTAGSGSLKMTKLTRYWWVIPLGGYVFFMLAAEAFAFHGLT